MRGSPTKEAIEETVHRLYTTPKISEKKQENGEDSIVSDLPSETLRWIKKRRHFESDQKVVVSHFRDKQLREMFQSLDYKNEGALDLQELTEAVEYVQEKTKHIKGLEAFQNIQELFAAMDDNGDGTVDLQEFTKAMTGTEKSAFDQASEYDIQRLFNYFVEFGEKRQRKQVLTKIEQAKEADRLRTLAIYESLNAPAASPKNRSKQGGNASRKAMMNTEPRTTESTISADMQAYHQFKVLFGFPEESVTTGNGNRPKSSTGGIRRNINTSPAPMSRPTSRGSTGSGHLSPGAQRVMSPKKIFDMMAKDEHLLDTYIYHSEEIAEKDRSLDYQKQSEYKQIHQKYKEKRREELEMKDDHQLDAIAMQKQAARERRLSMSKKLYLPGIGEVNPLSHSSSRPSTETIQQPPGRIGGASTTTTTTPSITTNHRPGGGNTSSTSNTISLIPARREMTLRSSARKEAYSILRSSQEVRASFFVSTQHGNTHAGHTTDSHAFSNTSTSVDDIEAAVQRISSQFQHSAGVTIKKDNAIIFEDMHLPSMKVTKQHHTSIPTRASFHMLQR